MAQGVRAERSEAEQMANEKRYGRYNTFMLSTDILRLFSSYNMVKYAVIHVFGQEQDRDRDG